jgi:uncharacterized protein DUF2786
MTTDPTGNTTGEPPLETIRKLLVMAERGATQGERDAFNAKAAALLAKYGVDRAMLAADDPTLDVVGDRIVKVPGPFSIDKAMLIGGIAEELGCRAIYKGSGGYRDVHLFGHASDMERAEILYTSLLVQMSQELAAAGVPWGENPAAYKRSFMSGFTKMVRWRLRQAETAARNRKEAERATTANGGGPAGPSVALVLVTRRDKVSARVSKAYPKLGKVRRSLSGGGDRDGQVAGRRANLSTDANLGRRNSGALPGGTR